MHMRLQFSRFLNFILVEVNIGIFATGNNLGGHIHDLSGDGQNLNIWIISCSQI
jgi:hypothetical protein